MFLNMFINYRYPLRLILSSCSYYSPYYSVLLMKHFFSPAKLVLEEKSAVSGRFFLLICALHPFFPRESYEIIIINHS
jgi:hypothetical protein